MPDPMTPRPSRAEVERLADRADKEVNDLCNGKKWRMSIPVQQDDSDIVISTAIATLRRALDGAAPSVTPEEFVGHTPGPWNSVKQFWPGQGESHIVMHSQGNPASSNINDHLVASCGKNGEANARLIAAAPDLLAEVLRLRGAAPETGEPVAWQLISRGRPLLVVYDSRDSARAAIERFNTNRVSNPNKLPDLYSYRPLYAGSSLSPGSAPEERKA